jgi:predicted methyltransferase
MKRMMLAMAVTISLCHSAYADEGLKTVLQGSQRSAEFVKRDVYRHPYETLNFFGIRPDMTVVELSPGGGWYTEILAPYLRDKGQYIAATNNPASASENSRKAFARFKQKLDADPAVYGQTRFGIFEPPANINYAAAGTVDMVLTFRNLHNWINNGGDQNLKNVFQAAYNSLKSGGVFGVVEHRLPESVPQDEKASTGYVHTSYVIRIAESAGFRLAGQSEINANPKDHADHENGVWALPPTLTNKDKDQAKYLAIGESDRMTLKFVKP